MLQTLDLDMRHLGAIDFAEDILIRELGDNLLDIILYGSCATGKWKFSSDVDLLVVVNEIDFKAPRLRGMCMPDTWDIADVDVHFVTREDYLERDDTYIRIIRREGVSILDKTKN